MVDVGPHARLRQMNGLPRRLVRQILPDGMGFPQDESVVFARGRAAVGIPFHKTRPMLLPFLPIDEGQINRCVEMPHRHDRSAGVVGVWMVVQAHHAASSQ
ncbi:MAG: hypothetical protein M0Z85_05035 [Gammaproteobacteria bacterium]|nr:hypothetical protein [Gammaproteobacteria bacterium]